MGFHEKRKVTLEEDLSGPDFCARRDADRSWQPATIDCGPLCIPDSFGYVSARPTLVSRKGRCIYYVDQLPALVVD